MAVLYRKYRSKSLDELVGQEHIADALRQGISKGQISHAYLFTGPRGTGKTSVARILAYELNSLPYDETGSHLDIIEIDAASNRRIDEIRDLREKVHIAPTSAKYKVYIIDEVHMLTKEAFNALLKTLEEPPEHAIFILATTELHKVPETIISRTQRFSFKPIEKAKIVDHLAYIAKQEGIRIDNEALGLIAEHAEGGFRDAISLLDQVRTRDGEINIDTVQDAIGAPSQALLANLWGALSAGSRAGSALAELYDRGYQAPLIASQLLKRAIIDHHTELAKKLLEVTGSHDPRTALQLLCLDTDSATATDVTPGPPIAEEKSLPPAPQRETISTQVRAKEEVNPENKTATKVDNPPKSVKPPDSEKTASHAELDTEQSDLWEKVLEAIKLTGNAVYGPLRLAKPHFEGDVLRLGLSFPFHVKRVSEAKNLDIVRDTLRSIVSKPYNVEVFRLEHSEEATLPVVTRAQKTAETVEPTKTIDPDAELMKDPLSLVKNVFGDAQIL